MSLPGVAQREAERRDTSTGTDVRWRPGVASVALPIVLVSLALVGGTFTSGFFSADNIKAILINAALTGVVAVAMTPLTLSGNMVALNLGSSATLAGVLFVYCLNHGLPVVVTLIAVPTVLISIGMVQALLVVRGLNPVVTTLAADSVIYGAVAELTRLRDLVLKHQTVGWLGSSQPLGVPVQVIIFAVFTVAVALFSAKTVAGRHVMLAGASSAAAKLSGVSRTKVIVSCFAILSVGVSVAGILNAAQLGVASSTDFPTLTFDVIAAVLIGGTSFQGGRGNPARSAGGAILIVIVSNVMLLHNLSTGWQYTGEGALVLVMVVLLHVLSRRSER